MLSFKVVQGTESSVELSYLNSLTEYQVAVFAVYRSSASEALRGSATTREWKCCLLTEAKSCRFPAPRAPSLSASGQEEL